MSGSPTGGARRRRPSPDVARLELKGTPVSPGVGLGQAWTIVDPASRRIPRRHLGAEEPEAALARFEAARRRAVEDLKRIQAVTTRELGIQDAAIYGAQIAVIQDPDARRQIERLILEERIQPESAIQELLDRFAGLFEKLEGGDIKTWAADLRDPWLCVVRELEAVEEERLELGPDARPVLIAEELTPSLVTRHHRQPLAGIACTRGGRFSHGALLARSFGIPTVTGLDQVHTKAVAGEHVVVLAEEGRVLFGIDEREREIAARMAAERERLRGVLLEASGEPGRTADGEALSVLVNIESPQDLAMFEPSHAAGVGLFRTEFAFMERPSFPGRDEQLEVYRSVLERFPGKPVVFRTLDIGGDKQLRYFQHPQEANPVLGWRGLRLSLEWRDLFLIQLEALVAAREAGDARILLPMVTTVEELREARRLVAQVCGDGRSIPVGVMIEVPAAAMALRELAKEADFVSVGTNDLTQYLFAVDRDNPWVSGLYQPYHPAHLRVLRHIARTCAALGTPLSVCGEMAGQKTGALFLVGTGYRQLSVVAASLQKEKALLREVPQQELRRLSHAAVGAHTSSEAFGILREAADRIWERVAARSEADPD
ncbi:MAG: phosphoenolpyruvate--protein phosphotransferase [Planctomycetota bacterium]|nr:MAG: phosphoenolpyruvate--protein phosphotransferase [Planctomycetota bacterium]